MGAKPETFFKETYFTCGFDSSIKAVATGKADGAAVRSLTYDDLRATDSTYTALTRVVATSEEFAIQPVAARPGLDPALVAKIRAAFLGADKDPEAKVLLDRMKIDRFVVIEDSAYDSIHRMNEEVAK